MTRDILYGEIARQRDEELRREAERRRITSPAPRSEVPSSPRAAVTIRHSRGSLARLSRTLTSLRKPRLVAGRPGERNR